MKISSLNFKNNLRGSAVLSLVHGKEMILKNEVKDFLTKDFSDQGYDEIIILILFMLSKSIFSKVSERALGNLPSL